MSGLAREQELRRRWNAEIDTALRYRFEDTPVVSSRGGPAHLIEVHNDVCRRCGLFGIEIANYDVDCYVGVRLRQWLVRAWASVFSGARQ